MRYGNEPVYYLNGPNIEGRIYANIWKQDKIAVIDPPAVMYRLDRFGRVTDKDDYAVRMYDGIAWNMRKSGFRYG